MISRFYRLSRPARHRPRVVVGRGAVSCRSMTDPRFPILSALTTPHDIADLSADALLRLASEMRDAIIATVSQTGGHLGASLGTVDARRLQSLFGGTED